MATAKLAHRRWNVRAGVGLLALAGLVATSLAIVLAAAERRSSLSPPGNKGGFAGWYAGPLSGLVPRLTHNREVLSHDFTIAVLALLVLYAIALACLPALRARWIVGAIVVCNVLFLLCPPLTLTDIFNYLGYARLGVVHHLNPYTSVPLQASHDAAYPFATWRRLPSPYGPLFTLATYPLAKLSLPAAYWVFKGAVMWASLGCVALVGALARRLGRPPVPAMALLGLNPLVLVYGLGGQHNDVFMLLLLLAGAYLLMTRREIAGGSALAAAVAVKASAGLLAPVLLLGTGRRIRGIVGVALGTLVMAAMTLIAFGPHLPAVGTQDRLVAPFSGPNLFGAAIGQGGDSAQIRRAASLVLLAGVACAALVAWRRRSAIGAAGWAGVVALLALGWVMPWYIAWVLPFVALTASRALRAVAAVLAVYLVLIWSPVGRSIAHHYGFKPTLTAVGRVNHRYLMSLLEAHPPRHHHRRRAHHLPGRAAARARSTRRQSSRAAPGLRPSRARARARSQVLARTHRGRPSRLLARSVRRSARGR